MEVWIAQRNDPKRGTGTQSDPFNGSFLDEVMPTIPPVSLIHFSSGLFRFSVRHAWYVRSGWIIDGAGMYDTTLQMSGPAPADPYITSCLVGEGVVEKTQIRDLTCDSNWAELSVTSPMGSGGEKNCKTGAISIVGNKNLMQRVRSINSYGSWANEMEQFAFCFLAYQDGSSVGNIMDSCRAELPAGNYGSPFALLGNNTNHNLVERAQVIGCFAQGQNNGRKSAWNTGGVNLAGIRNCVISRCTFLDCMVAAYHDTDIIDGLLLENCTLIRGAAGFMNNSPNADKNVTIRHNHFSIQNRQDGNWSLGIGNIGTGTLTGIDLEDNEIFKDPTGHGVDALFGISLRGGSNAKVLRNILDRTINNFVPPGTQCFGNRDAHGKLVPGLEDTIKPAPLKIGSPPTN